MGKRKAVGYEPRSWEKDQPKEGKYERTFNWEREEHGKERGGQAGASSLAANAVGEGFESDYAGESDDDCLVHPGNKLLELLLEAHMTNQVMTARLLTSIAYWGSQCGIEALAGLALSPPKETDKRGEIGGHAKRKVDQFLNKQGRPSLVTYTVPMPSFLPQTRERGTYPLEIIPPHMAIESIPDAQWEGLVRKVKQVNLPRSYTEHPVVKEHPNEVVMPWAIFLDGLQYSKRGSMLVITLSLIAQDHPKLILGVLRKKLYCRCGCRGWCNLHALFASINWSLEHLAMGKHPMRDHLGNELDTEPYKALAGKSLRARSIVTQLRLDWSECTTLGLPTWRAGDCPCLLCKVNGRGLVDFSGLSSLRETVFDPLLQADYLESCQECELQLSDINSKEWADLKILLNEDKRKQGSRGLCVSKAYHALGVKKGDRIEPTQSQPDWAALLESTPTRLLLWRRGSESFARHRNPILSSSITHVSMETCYAIDWMHTLCLGVHGQFVAALLWRAAEANIFKLRDKDKEDIVAKTLERLERSNLRPFYKSKRGATTLSQVDKLCQEMLGTREAPALSAKASETLWLLHWATDPTYGIRSWPTDIGEAWIEGAACLDGLWLMFQDLDYVVPVGVQEDLAKII
eukprot:6490004-Amphidinium_carterae.1